jgi:hypothetical protein
MSALARSSSGETLELTAYDGRELKLISERALAPGQRLALQVDVGIGFVLDLKSHGSVKQEDGRYLVRARATTLSKHARDALDKLFGRSASGGAP